MLLFLSANLGLNIACYNAGRTPSEFFTLLPLSLTSPDPPFTNAALLSLLPCEQSHHATLSLLYGAITIRQIPFHDTPLESLAALRYNQLLPAAITSGWLTYFRIPSPLLHSSMHGSVQKNPLPSSGASMYVHGPDALCSLRHFL